MSPISSSEDPPVAKSPDMSKGTEKKKGSADGAASPKSKKAVKSKESGSGKKSSQKGRDFTKMVRSSLPELSAVDEEQEEASETANTLASANTDKSSSDYATTGAVIVAISFVVGGALIAA